MGKIHSKNKKLPPPKLPTTIEIRTWVGGAQAKMSLFRSKKVNEIRAKKKDVIELLKQNNLDVAKTKMETIIQAEDTITIYDILVPQCEILKERCTYLLTYENVPVDIKDTLDTIIYASNRLEVEELHKLREMIRVKYGDAYVMSADTNKDRNVNINVIEKLKVKPNTDAFLIVRLKQIVAESKINFTFPPEFEYDPSVANQHNFNEQQPQNMNPYMDNSNNMMNSQMSSGNFNPYMSNMLQNFNNNSNFNPYSNMDNNPYSNNNFNQSNINPQYPNNNDMGFQQMPPQGNNNFPNQMMPQAQMENNSNMQFPQVANQKPIGDFPQNKQQPNIVNNTNSYASFNPYKEDINTQQQMKPALGSSNVEFNQDFSHLHKMDGFPTNQTTTTVQEPKKEEPKIEPQKDENEELSKKISELHLGDTYINDSPTVSRIEEEKKE